MWLLWWVNVVDVVGMMDGVVVVDVIGCTY